MLVESKALAAAVALLPDPMSTTQTHVRIALNNPLIGAPAHVTEMVVFLQPVLTFVLGPDHLYRPRWFLEIRP